MTAVDGHDSQKPRAPWLVLAIALAILFLVTYAASPMFALMSLRKAAQEGDRDRLAELVDFPAVRDDLKSQISAQMMSSIRSNSDLGSNAVAALGLAFAPALIDRAIDAYITRDGLAQIMRTSKAPSAQPAAPSTTRSRNTTAEPQPTIHYEYLSLNRFRARMALDQDEAQSLSLIMERRGVFSWKLVRIGLPLPAPAPKAVEPPPTNVPQPPPVPARVAAADANAPPSVGECTTTRVKEVTSRLEGAPDSGSAIEYEDGKAQVSYDLVPGIQQSQPGDPITLCVVSLPQDCPPGDNRGIVYNAVNGRTGVGWKEADSEHMCGGA